MAPYSADVSDVPAPAPAQFAPATPWAIAGAASLGAALVHGAAAGSHADDRQLSALFAAAALAQATWGVWALGCRSGRAAAVVGILLHGFALGVLVLAWTSGVAVIDGLAEPQNPGVQDGIVAGLEAVALLAAVALTVLPSFASPRRGAIPALAAAVLLIAAVPAMAAPHEHSASSGGDDKDHSEQVAAGHIHDDSHGHDDPHSGDDPADPADAIQEEAVDGIVLPNVDGITAEQKDRALDLIRRTREGLARFADPAAAQAAGFISIGDAFTGFEHYVHYGYLENQTVLDANEPESIVYKVSGDGTRELASAMYILPRGTTMEDVPDVAGAMTPWHDHRNLCWSPDGRLAGLFVNGKCTAGEHRITPPMLHVWVIDHVCGPFAGIEGGSTPQTPEECPTHAH